MSVSKWAYTPEKCDGQPCPGDCDHCAKREEIEALRDRPTGEWIEAELDKGFRVCSVCKNKGYKDKMAWRTDFVKSYLNFCPNCGARMKGGAE